MIIPVTDGRGWIADIEIAYDTNGMFVAKIDDFAMSRDVQDGRSLRTKCAEKGYGFTIQIAFDNLRAKLAL